MPMDQDKLHADIIAVRNTEANLGWIRNVFYSGLNSAMFGLLIDRLHSGTDGYTALCSGGIALSFFWFVTTKRSREWMTYWHKCLGAIEHADGDIAHQRVFIGSEFEKMDTKRIRSHVMLRTLVVGTGIVWNILFFYSLVLEFFIGKTGG
jgi:hypothetical protein